MELELHSQSGHGPELGGRMPAEEWAVGGTLSIVFRMWHAISSDIVPASTDGRCPTGGGRTSGLSRLRVKRASDIGPGVLKPQSARAGWEGGTAEPDRDAEKSARGLIVAIRTLASVLLNP